MTPQAKARMKMIMEEHLKKLGWPTVANADQLVLNEVENMFRLLLKENLVLHTDYTQFFLSAISAYEKARLRKSGFII